MWDMSKMPAWAKTAVKKREKQIAVNAAVVDALVEEAIGTCLPEGADDKSEQYTRQVLRRKFSAILGT